MKRLLVLLLASLMLFAFVACDDNTPDPPAAEETNTPTLDNTDKPDNPAPEDGDSEQTENPGYDIPDIGNVPEVTDGVITNELTAIMQEISGFGLGTPDLISNEYSSEYEYRSSDDTILAKFVCGSAITPKLTVEVDGYSILNKGSVILFAEGDSYDLSNVTQINVGDNQYISGQEGFDEAKKELMELVERVAYTVYSSESIAKNIAPDPYSHFMLTRTSTFDYVYDGFIMKADVETMAATGTVSLKHELDKEYEGFLGFTWFWTYENATWGNPSSLVVQFHGGEFDGKVYSLDEWISS